MTPDCLVKIKPIVSETVYAQLDEALQKGDQKTWDLVMEASHSDVRYMKRAAILDANKKASIINYVQTQMEKGVKPQQAVLDLVSGAGVRQEAGVVSLDKYIEGVRGKYIAMNTDLIDATRPKLLGLQRSSNPEFVTNIVKGIFGDADASIPKGGQAIIDAWHKTTKDILLRFNKAGGSITELKGFNIPVNHYSPALLKTGEDEWVTDALRLFDIRRRADLPQIDEEDLLRKIYKNIVTEGAASSTFGETVSERYKKLGNSHQQFRYLQPKSGAAWMEYNTKYGRHTNPIDSMKEYIDSMSTEIGLMEVFGTNPTKMLDDMVDEVRRVTGNNRAGTLAKASMDQIRSRNPAVEDTISNTFKGLRALQTITKLPLSGITAISDVAFSSVRSGYLGMNPVKVFTRQMKNLITTKDYKTASRLGLLAEYANSRAISSARYSESIGFSKLDRVADFALRANGLNHWTNSGRATFGMEFLSNMAEHAHLNFEDLPRGLRSAFQRYGITADDWRQIFKSIEGVEDVEFINPTNLEDELMAKVLGMIREETNFAIPEPNAKARAIATAGIPTNTVANEMVKTMTQFKSFGVSVLVSNMGILLDKGLPTPTKLAYGASLFTSTAIMGVVVLQLKDIAKGREPREITPELVKEGFVQGGALGVAGDVFFNDPNLFGGLPAYIAGPTVGDLQRISKVMWATKDEVFKDGGDWQKELFPAAERAAEELAFPLRLWQTRVAMERLMLDQTRRLTDPDYYSKLQRTRKWLREERNQGYWSEPK